MAKVDERVKLALGRCKELFHQKGIRGVSIEDIARTTSMSKNLLYKQFENKEGIVQQVLAIQLQNLEDQMKEVQQKAENAIDELLQLHHFYIKMFSTLNPVMLFDLKKFYSEQCSIYEGCKGKLHTDFIIENFARGLKESLYRNDFDAQIVLNLWERNIEYVKEEILFGNNTDSIIHLSNELTELHLRSIASSLGLDYINTYFRTKIAL